MRTVFVPGAHVRTRAADRRQRQADDEVLCRRPRRARRQNVRRWVSVYSVQRISAYAFDEDKPHSACVILVHV